MEMYKSRILRRPVMLVTLAVLGGCSRSDQRLVEMANQSIATQHEQNDAMARQSESVLKESHELAVAAGQLVDRDAQARRDLIQADAQLHDAIHDERVSVDRQRAELDQERRTLAAERQRDPVIAMAILEAATLLACVAPLVLAAYALRQVGRTNSQSFELGELVLSELAAGDRRLLPWPEAQLLPPPNGRADATGS